MISVAEWQPSYGDPHTLEDTQEYATVWEHERPQAIDCTPEPRPPLTFVDGVRRGEAWIYLENGTALAAVLATGAVVGTQVQHIAVERLFLRPEYSFLRLPEQPGGWSWRTVPLEAEQNPEMILQASMRAREAELAMNLASQGQMVVADGPLIGAAKVSGLSLVGCVKTQERLLLGPDDSGCLAELQPGQRSSVFGWAEKHGCYVRLARRERHQHPYFGLVRLETVGEAEWARQWLHRVAGWIPDFAGVAHLDPRAPQNLQPVAGLERELRRRCGDSQLALRALRRAVSQLRESVSI